MEPVGTTLYIYGGGWDWQDVGSSLQARTIGVSSDWVRFFVEQDENFTFKSKDGNEDNSDPSNSYYPYGGYNEYYYAGLDCSGFLGWALYNTLETEDGPLKALKMAAKSVGPGKEVVSHSDRGCQYGSHAYRELLEALGWKSSMTEELHCYENAMAERLNGILKCEYFLDRHFKTKAEARKAIKEAIWIYNHRRLHEKLGYKTPVAFRAEWRKAA